jgi:hypothetical protein
LEDNIKMDSKVIEFEVLDYIELGPVAGCCEHGNEPSGSIRGGGFVDLLSDISFLRRTLFNGVCWFHFLVNSSISL